MFWIKYSSLFLSGTIKFLFSSVIGWKAGMPYWEIVLVSGLGALMSFNVFYLGSSYFFKRAEEKAKTASKQKRKFTRTNRMVVRIKGSRWGFELICLLCPLFLSVPGGSLVVSRLFGDKKKTYWFTTLCITSWAIVLPWVWVFLA